MCDIKKIEAEIVTKATAKLKLEVEKELEIEDPEKEKSEAILKGETNE